jgi:hypothetical protein
MKTYIIKKVKYLKHDGAESYPLDSTVDFDVYGLYEVKEYPEEKMYPAQEGMPTREYWVSDHDTIADAEFEMSCLLKKENEVSLMNYFKWVSRKLSYHHHPYFYKTIKLGVFKLSLCFLGARKFNCRLEISWGW